MKLLHINRQPSRKDLRVFAWLWCLFVLGVSFLLVRQPNLIATAIIALLPPVLAEAAPSLVRYLYIGLAYAAFPIGFVVSHVVLASIFFLVITPIGLLLRIFGVDPLTRRLTPGATSYWVERAGRRDLQTYFRQS